MVTEWPHEWTVDQVRVFPSRAAIADMEARLTREAEEDEADDE